MVRTAFAALHEGATPFRLPNAWDAFSARVLALAGAPAIGTTSFGVGYAHGAADGQQLPWDQVRVIISAAVASVSVPVTADIEAGWGDVERSVADVVEAGVAGINLEDSRPDAPGKLFGVAEQADRIAQSREGGPDLFVNARCDVWFGAALHEDERLDAAVERAAAYAAAGADGLFVPGCTDTAEMRAVADASGLPVNVATDPRLQLPPDGELAAAGVRRISQGGSAFLAVLHRLHEIARLHIDGDPDPHAGEALEAIGLLGGLNRKVRQ